MSPEAIVFLAEISESVAGYYSPKSLMMSDAGPPSDVSLIFGSWMLCELTAEAFVFEPSFCERRSAILLRIDSCESLGYR